MVLRRAVLVGRGGGQKPHGGGSVKEWAQGPWRQKVKLNISRVRDVRSRGLLRWEM